MKVTIELTTDEEIAKGAALFLGNEKIEKPKKTKRAKKEEVEDEPEPEEKPKKTKRAKKSKKDKEPEEVTIKMLRKAANTWVKRNGPEEIEEILEAHDVENLTEIDEEDYAEVYAAIVALDD